MARRGLDGGNSIRAGLLMHKRGKGCARRVAVPHGFSQVSAWRSLAAQNFRQRIEFWAISGVQPIEYGKEGQVTGCLKFLILGVRLKIRSFGGSFEALVLQGGRFRRKRSVSEDGSEKAGVFVPVGQTPPLENSSQKGKSHAKRPLRTLGCSVWAMLAAP